jgi:ABC-type branched-subunit amino acid transport system permease subunit
MMMMRSPSFTRALPVLLAFALLAALPWLTSGFRLEMALKIMILAIFALSLELLVGQTGLVCFGHAAFFGIGAYVAALMTPQDGPASLWIALPAALLVAGVYALAVGALSLRTKGVYFIMITLAFAQMAYFVFHDTPLGGGSDGIYLYFKPDAAIAGFKPFDLDAGASFYFLPWPAWWALLRCSRACWPAATGARWRASRRTSSACGPLASRPTPTSWVPSCCPRCWPRWPGFSMR